LDFIKHTKSIGATLLATSERTTQNIDEIRFSVQDFIFEGLINLSMVRKGSVFERCIHVYKMRGQSHLLGIFPLSISNKGMIVHTQQIPFSLIDQDARKKNNSK
ncbi:MAG: hypothetical protein NT001_02930, partial [Candidatus Woesearchaeota archaeon]|nr:hypothetical protein [Candidatus Woesearchaeota archaeon]